MVERRKVVQQEAELSSVEDAKLLIDLLSVRATPESQRRCTDESLMKKVEEYLVSVGKDDESSAQLLTLAHPFALLQGFHEVYRSCLVSVMEKYNFRGEKAFQPTASHIFTRASLDGRLQIAQPGTLHRSQSAQLGFKAPSRISRRELNKEPEVRGTSDTEEAKSNWEQLWEEFFNRYPYHYMSLTRLSQELHEARKEKEVAEARMKDIMDKIRQNKAELDQAMWVRKAEIGDKVSGNGRIIVSELEKTALDTQMSLNEEYEKQMSEAEYMHRRYQEYSSKFNSHFKEITHQLIGYVSTMYHQILLLPSTELYRLYTTRDCMELDTGQKSEDEFFRLQNKHFKQRGRNTKKECLSCDSTGHC